MSIEFKKQKDIDSKKEYYEKRLWDEAEHLEETRNALLERQKLLYGKLNDSANPIKDFDLRRKMEDEYWNISKSLEAVAQKENQIQSLLEQLNKGNIEESKLKGLFPYEDQTEKDRITKNKAHRLEQLRAIREGNTGDFGYDDVPRRSGGSYLEPNRLTTGRHATGVKNVGSSLDAEGEFFYRTADTHGGKVDYGKNGVSYVSSSGRRVRKK